MAPPSRSLARHPAAVATLSLAVGALLAVAHAGCGASTSSGAPITGTPRNVSLELRNNCGGATSIKVLVNVGGQWKSDGQVRCAGGQTCTVAPGVYGLDATSAGLDFYVGATPDDSTKVEITNVDQPSFDISVISMGGGCDNSCTQASCCNQHFDHPVRVTQTPDCRCLACDGPACPDAFHWPTNNEKQVNCTGIDTLKVEFCPAAPAACPAPPYAACTPTQQATCRPAPNSGCTGELAVCNPGTGGTPQCFCLSGTWCVHPTQAGTACAQNPANCCWVRNE